MRKTQTSPTINQRDVRAETQRKALLDDLKLGLPTRTNDARPVWLEPSPACKAILGGINTVMLGDDQYSHNYATEDCDMYQLACLYLWRHLDSFMKTGTAELYTRLFGLGHQSRDLLARSSHEDRGGSCLGCFLLFRPTCSNRCCNPRAPFWC